MLVCLRSITAVSDAAAGRVAANLSDKSGNTPLHCAAQEGCLDVLELFSRMPRDEVSWLATNNDGKTAAELATGHARTRFLQRNSCDHEIYQVLKYSII